MQLTFPHLFLVGTPYGGTAILFNRALSGLVSVIDTCDPRRTALKFISSVGPVLLVCAYLPCDIGDLDCLVIFTDTML